MKNSLTLSNIFEAHVHYRQKKRLREVAPITADYCSYAVVMPNTHPPVCTADHVVRYRQEILDVTNDTGCIPLMTFKILPNTNPESLNDLKSVGAVAGKLYPKGLTTNAEDGVDKFFDLNDVYAKMESLGLVLCIHGEMPGKDIEGHDREKAFLQTLRFIARMFPKLRIVLEHITTEDAVNTVLSLPDNVVATITGHHLLLTRDDAGGDRLNVHNYCKPVAKTVRDRAALVYAATSGCAKFFMGSDSAPHDQDKKESAPCCAGVFTAPVLLPILAELFEREDALPRLQTFVSDSAFSFYQPQHLATHKEITLVKESWQVPSTIHGIVPFRAGETLEWQIAT